MGYKKMSPFFLLWCSVVIAGSETECVGDEDCPVQSYCVASRCYECFDCSLTKRHANSTCPKTVYDCGNCFNGFEDVSLTDDAKHFKKPCKRQDTLGGQTGCHDDKDCALGQFCHEYRVCAVCLDCSSYQRQNTLACARSVEDCGKCLPGYFDVAVTDGSRPKPCQSSAAPYQSHFQSQQTEVHINVGALSLIASVLVVSAIMICAFLIYTSKKSPAQTGIVTVESPPPYQENSDESGSSIEEAASQLVCGFYKETSDEECCARVFRLPEYIAPSQTVPSPRNDRYEEEVTDSPVDEETLPCPWRPERQEDGNSEPLSFSGRLTVGFEPPPATLSSAEQSCRCDNETTDEPVAKRIKE